MHWLQPSPTLDRNDGSIDDETSFANHSKATSFNVSSSALSVMDFMKRSSIGYVTAKGWPDMSKAARKLAEYEGFSSHANAVGPMRTPYLGQGD